MPLLKTEPFPDFSKKLSKNRWADFIEVLCLNNLDKEISLNDIVSHYTQESAAESLDGDEMYSERSLALRAEFLETFRYIMSRQRFLNDFYPFESIDEDTIRLSGIDDAKLLYIYFLFSSNTMYFTDKTIPPLFTSYFERLSLLFMKTLYPNFRNEMFGTANQPGDSFYGGTLLDKLAKLSRRLNTTLTQKTINDPHNRVTGGDKGLDIVSFYDLDIEFQEVSFKPVCFGQCSCSYDEWNKKQFSIDYDKWRDRLNDITAFHRYIFIPFPLRGIDGCWAKEEHAEIQTIVIDRFRFFSLLKLNSISATSVLSDDIKSKLRTYLGELNVSIG
jgi:hypothetical protein